MSNSKKDHINYIQKKEEKTIKLYNEQMIQGKIFGTPFEKIDNLSESFSDFKELMTIESDPKPSKNTKPSKDKSTNSNDIPSEEFDYHD